MQQQSTQQDNNIITTQLHNYAPSPLPVHGLNTSHDSDPFHQFPNTPSNSTSTIPPQMSAGLQNAYTNQQPNKPMSQQSNQPFGQQDNKHPNQTFSQQYSQNPTQQFPHGAEQQRQYNQDPNQAFDQKFTPIPVQNPSSMQNASPTANVLEAPAPQNNYVPPSKHFSAHNTMYNPGIRQAIKNPSSTTAAFANSAAANTQKTDAPQSSQNGNAESLKNQKFIILALLSSIIITVLIIGLGTALLAPKNITPLLSKEDTLSPQNNKQTNKEVENPDNTQVETDLRIIYGTESNTTSPREEVIIKKEPTSKVVKTPVAKAPVKNRVAKAVASTQKATPLTATSVASSNTNSLVSAKPSVAFNSIKTQYWIQIFSTPNRDKVTQIKKELMSQGLNTTVVTKTIDQTIYYRLRIGPYYNKDEGNKFLTWIRKNDNYKDAYMSVARHSSGS